MEIKKSAVILVTLGMFISCTLLTAAANESGWIFPVIIPSWAALGFWLGSIIE